MTYSFKYSFILSFFILVCSCSEKKEDHTKALAIADTNKVEKEKEKPNPLSKEFKDYWYRGEAEITSYKLEQVRYGEIKNGHAVLIFVTEDFLPDVQVKADNYSKANTSVLKLNATKKFNTGIYPYSIMESTFYPVANNAHAVKITASAQEWCGHVYTQINNRKQFEVLSHSYFQNEADEAFKLEKTWTENELWVKLRINPKSLPVGPLKIIPSLEYTRLWHKDIKAYDAVATLEDGKYIISYSDLERSLTINFNTNFPYHILGWEETLPTGHGNTKTTLTTKATVLKSLKSDYWRKNSNADLHLRDSLGI